MGQNRFLTKNIVCVPKKTTKLVSASVSTATLYYIKVVECYLIFVTLPSFFVRNPTVIEKKKTKKPNKRENPPKLLVTSDKRSDITHGAGGFK